jgi:hypothetical protein
VFAKYQEMVHFVVLYQREAHANEFTFKEIDQPDTMDERKVLASRCREELGLTWTIVVDGMNDAVREAYGGLPNSAYIINTEGVIVFKEAWAHPDEWPAVLDELLGED